MPNEVYLRTHDGLSAMVSSRAASRVLDDALRFEGLNADEVDGDSMRDLLLGPVLKGLEGILPRDGLRRNLIALAAGLPEIPARGDALPRGEAAPPRGDFRLEEDDAEPTGADALEPSPERLAALLSDGPASGSRTEGAVALGGAAAPSAAPAVVPARPPAAPASPPAPAFPPIPTSPLDAAILERAAVEFAQIEHVRLVAALRGDGSIVSSRGGGVDLATLSRLGLMGLRLLARSGELRSYHLGHDAGHLFLFPLGSDVLVVLGTPELNLGAVFAAHAAFKEES